MKNNQILLILAAIIIIIFGGTFTIRYFRHGEILLDQLIVAFIGLILLLASLLWRKKYINIKD